MSGFTQILSSIFEYLIITGISFVSFLIVLSVIFSDSPKKAKSKLQAVYLLILLINIVLFLVIFGLFGTYFGDNLVDPGLISFVFMLVLTFVFSMKTAMKMKNSIPRTKRGGNLAEISKEILKGNTFDVIEISLIFFLPLVSMYIMGNGSLNSLLAYLLISNFIVTATSILLLPGAFRIFNNILD
jgi:uncharacterized membrane protein